MIINQQIQKIKSKKTVKMWIFNQIANLRKIYQRKGKQDKKHVEK